MYDLLWHQNMGAYDTANRSRELDWGLARLAKLPMHAPLEGLGLGGSTASASTAAADTTSQACYRSGVPGASPVNANRSQRVASEGTAGPDSSSAAAPAACWRASEQTSSERSTWGAKAARGRAPLAFLAAAPAAAQWLPAAAAAAVPAQEQPWPAAVPVLAAEAAVPLDTALPAPPSLTACSWGVTLTEEAGMAGMAGSSSREAAAESALQNMQNGTCSQSVVVAGVQSLLAPQECSAWHQPCVPKAVAFQHPGGCSHPERLPPALV